MIPVSTLYDEYIERRKFTEQKKNPVEYIVSPPSRGSEQLYSFASLIEEPCKNQAKLFDVSGKSCKQVVVCAAIKHQRKKSRLNLTKLIL